MAVCFLKVVVFFWGGGRFEGGRFLGEWWCFLGWPLKVVAFLKVACLTVAFFFGIFFKNGDLFDGNVLVGWWSLEGELFQGGFI